MNTRPDKAPIVTPRQSTGSIYTPTTSVKPPVPQASLLSGTGSTKRKDRSTGLGDIRTPSHPRTKGKTKGWSKGWPTRAITYLSSFPLMYLVIPAYLAYASREEAGATHVRFGSFSSSSNRATQGEASKQSREGGIFANLILHCILGIQLSSHSFPVGPSSRSSPNSPIYLYYLSTVGYKMHNIYPSRY